jgi:hypothetical protein
MRTPRVALTAAAVAAAALAASPAAQAKTASTTCKGDDNRCVATLSLNGGQSRTHVVINLLGTDMELRSVHVTPASDRGAFNLSHQSFRLGGSQYTALLSAADGIGKFQLRFLFKAR